MTELTPGRARVFTFKAGLLSRVAHDLRLRVEGWTVRGEAGSLEATFRADSLRVDGVMEDGALQPDALSARNRRSIEATVRDELLRSSLHPRVRWSGSARRDGDVVRLDGALTLRGQTHPASCTGRVDAGVLRISAPLVPSRWGIEPYSAMLGAIRLQDRVRVEVDIAGWSDA